MSNYFLIARNKSDNSYQVLEINEQWFLGDKGNDIFYRANDLEAIDLVTSQFSNREEFIERLFANGYVDSKDIDVFVANVRKKENKKYIKFNEVIYGFSNNYRLTALKDIANASLGGNVLYARKSIYMLYDDLISSVYFSPGVYNMITDSATNMDLRFAKLLKKVPEWEEVPYDIKYDWDTRYENYVSLRNIVETLNRVKQLNCSFRENLEEKNEEFVDSNLYDRMALIPELSITLDKHFSEEQLSLFSSDKKEKVRVATREVVKEEWSVPKIEIPRKNVSELEKKEAIYRVLKTLNLNTFSRKGDSFVINYNAFLNTIPDDERRKLDTLLTGNMTRFFASYVFHYSRLQEAHRCCAGSYEIGELQADINRDVARISKRFKSSKCLNMTYEWCMLYEGCMKRDALYCENESNINNGGANAKVFGKRK